MLRPLSDMIPFSYTFISRCSYWVQGTGRYPSVWSHIGTLIIVLAWAGGMGAGQDLKARRSRPCKFWITKALKSLLTIEMLKDTSSHDVNRTCLGSDPSFRPPSCFVYAICKIENVTTKRKGAEREGIEFVRNHNALLYRQRQHLHFR